MPFSFLNPWLWLGALALGVPIWLHLRRKQEKNLLRFSAVRFLEDEPLPRQQPHQLRDVFLFALRALALMLVVGAFTWPYVRNANTVPVRESRVYILDNTLSHQAQDGFGHDRDALAKEIVAAEWNVQIAVIELAGVPRVLGAFGDERQAVAQRVKELQPSFQRGSYVAAFRQANSLLANSLGARKRIVFLSDNQENQWRENASMPPFLRDVEVDLPKPSAARQPNISLSEPRAQRIFLGDKSLIHFTVKLSHTGPAATADFTLRANDQVILNRTIGLDKEPETILVQAQWEADTSTWLRGEVSAEGKPDALAADNRVFFSVPPVIEGKVALLAQSPYLRLALSPDVMRGQWATRVLEPAKLAEELASGQDAEVLCLESSYLQSNEARKLLSRYLTNGRGALLFVNRVTPAIKGCLRELGFEAENTVQAPPDSPEKFQFVFANHPIFHPFLSPDYGNLLDIRVERYTRIKGVQAMPLVFSEKGAGLFFQGSKTLGKLFVAAFGMDRQHTSWPVHQSYIPFLDLALQAARADDPTPNNFESGEIAVVQVPVTATNREVVLKEGARELKRATLVHGKAQVALPDRPGLYDLTYDDRPAVEKVFSVNPSPKESQLTYLDGEETLKTWRLDRPGEPARASPAVAEARVSLAGILQQRLWWWMVVGSLAALLIETALAALKRERV
jgi:hypothetical protein